MIRNQKTNHNQHRFGHAHPMTNLPRELLALLTITALLAAACGGASDSSTNDDSESAAADSDPMIPDALSQSFEAFGNPNASTVIVVAQGGPMPELVIDEAKDIFSDVDLDNTYVVVPHQAQTREPALFTGAKITFDQAKEYDTATTSAIADVVAHYAETDKKVHVVGISFGAFVVQDLLVTQGNVADGYFIQVGRLDMPEEVWKPFSEGHFVGFTDGVNVESFDADGAGMGGDGDFTDANMARLAAGLGHKRFTELLADTDLGNVVYATGLQDEQVGRLGDAELAFLADKGVKVLQTEEDHGGTIDETIAEGLTLIGALPSDE